MKDIRQGQSSRLQFHDLPTKKKVPTTWIFTEQETQYLNKYKSTDYELSPEKKV